MLHRDDSGKLPAYAWPGSYPLVYHVEDGGKLCPECANGGNGSEASEAAGTDRQWHLTGVDAHMEGEPVTCDHCGKSIDSACGEPEDDSAEPAEPDEADYVMSDVRGGVGVSLYGKHVGTFDDRDLAEAAIREDAKQGNYWPNVWFVSDHGNAHLVTDWRWG